MPEHKEAPVVVEKPASPEHHEAPLVVEKPAPIVSEPVIAQSAATPVATSSLASNQSIANSLIIVLNYAVSEVTLSPKNIEKLASLKSIIKNEKDKIINVVGYSSDNNTKDLNITGNLALQRVVEVRKYLISQNIDAAQISIHSASNKLPITIQDKVEITIIDSKRSKK